jgi:hypothetical protein
MVAMPTTFEEDGERVGCGGCGCSGGGRGVEPDVPRFQKIDLELEFHGGMETLQPVVWSTSFELHTVETAEGLHDLQTLRHAHISLETVQQVPTQF